MINEDVSGKLQNLESTVQRALFSAFTVYKGSSTGCDKVSCDRLVKSGHLRMAKVSCHLMGRKWHLRVTATVYNSDSILKIESNEKNLGEMSSIIFFSIIIVCDSVFDCQFVVYIIF